MLVVEEERGCGSMRDFGGEIRSDLAPAKHFCAHAMAPTTYDNMVSQSGISKNINEQSSWKIFKSAFAKVSQTMRYGSRVAPLKPCSVRDVPRHTGQPAACPQPALGWCVAAPLRCCPPVFSHLLVPSSRCLLTLSAVIARSWHSGHNWRHRLLHVAGRGQDEGGG